MSGLRGAFQGLQKLALARLPHLNWGVLGGGGVRVLGFWGLGFWGLGRFRVLGVWGFGVLGFWGLGFWGVWGFGV